MSTTVALVVTWDDPEPGVAVYGPYPDSDAAWIDWGVNHIDSFCNEGEWPGDVDVQVIPLGEPGSPS